MVEVLHPSGVKAERLEVLDGRVITFQPVKGYRSAVDPVLLQAAVPARKGDRVLELGAGAGTASLCLARRVAGASVTGLEQLRTLVDLATHGARENGFGQEAVFVEGDLLKPPTLVKLGKFDHVMANPPFQKKGTSRPSDDPIKAAATVEGRAELTDWIAAASAHVKTGGTVTFIHRADRLGDVLIGAAGLLGALTVLPILPDSSADQAKRIIFQGTKGSKAPMRLLPDFLLHEEGGNYTETADDVLRGRGVLKLSTED